MQYHAQEGLPMSWSSESGVDPACQVKMEVILNGLSILKASR